MSFCIERDRISVLNLMLLLGHSRDPQPMMSSVHMGVYKDIEM